MYVSSLSASFLSTHLRAGCRMSRERPRTLVLEEPPEGKSLVLWAATWRRDVQKSHGTSNTHLTCAWVTAKTCICKSLNLSLFVYYSHYPTVIQAYKRVIYSHKHATCLFTFFHFVFPWHSAKIIHYVIYLSQITMWYPISKTYFKLTVNLCEVILTKNC